MGTRHIRNKLSNDFNVYWRRRWDSNPRRGSPLAQLATECFRPLSHASDEDYLKGQGLGGKGKKLQISGQSGALLSSRELASRPCRTLPTHSCDGRAISGLPARDASSHANNSHGAAPRVVGNIWSARADAISTLAFASMPSALKALFCSQISRGSTTRATFFEDASQQCPHAAILGWHSFKVVDSAF